MKSLALSHGLVVAPKAPFAGLKLTNIRKAFAVARERRALRNLTSTQLRDIGVDPVHAQIESARSFWDLPAGR